MEFGIASYVFKSKMASSSKRPRACFSAEEVVEMCTRGGSDSESEFDSDTGGLSSGEEFELDRELEVTSISGLR